MRRPVATRLLALAIVVLGPVTACNDDDASGSTSTTTSAADLSALALEIADLPAGFAAAAEVDDTITSFCVNEDATAGLQASDRVIRGFTRTPAGASVIQLLLRFDDEGAATFVDQARAILDRCSGVPDVSGLAFEYEDLTGELDRTIAEASDTHVGVYGVSVGSGTLAVNIAVLARGDVGQLVAVLGLDLPRSELDALAAATFSAATEHLMGRR